jgi:predicted amino acid dehydrogenase
VALLARERAVDRLTLMARSRARLEALGARVSAQVPTVVTTDLDDILDADVVVLLTAASDTVLACHHLKPGAVVLDATQPRNTSQELLTSRPDVTVVDGGIVSVPSLRLQGGNIGLPDGRAYACFAETALLALSGHRGHFAIGVPTLDQVDHVRALAADHADLGFAPAEPTSFGHLLNQRTTPLAAVEDGPTPCEETVVAPSGAAA